MYDAVKFKPAGDKGLVVELGNEISRRTNYCVRNLYLGLKQLKVAGVDEIVPAYCSLLVYYDPDLIRVRALIGHIRELIANMSGIKLPAPGIFVIPVLYGGIYGPDIEHVALHNKITTDDVITMHTGVDYLIYMIGFVPGFPYFGGMPQRIFTPRLSVPKKHIPAGSVGIADKQTGIYPVDSPGGWQIIGRTPVKLYDPYRYPPMLLAAGNYVRMKSINHDEYEEIKKQIEQGTYTVEVLERQPGEED